MASETAVRLRTITSDLRAWLDTIDAMDEDEDNRELALREFAAAITTAQDKVARFAAFVLRAEAEAEFSREEAKRLTLRARAFDTLVNSLKDYAIFSMEDAGLVKLDGHGHTLSVRKKPASVLITDEAAVPSEFKVLTITVPAQAWEDHVSMYRSMAKACRLRIGEPSMRELFSRPLCSCDGGWIRSTQQSGDQKCDRCNGTGITDPLCDAKTEVSIDKTAVKKALAGGIVPGADLRIDGRTLKIS